MDHYGYYIFLGMGDFRDQVTAPDVTSAWDLKEWERRIDRLADLGTNTVFLYMMGHTLPFPTAAYPECVEKGHPNVEGEFFQKVLDRMTQKGMKAVACFTTTGHCIGFARAHPETIVVEKSGQLTQYRDLVCHNNPIARQYPLRVIDECLSRYKGFSGIILHPPEFHKPCFCEHCKKEFRNRRGSDLAAATDLETTNFFMETNLEFQKNGIEKMIHGHLPDALHLTFTNPWIFEAGFESFAGQIDRKTAIVDWDYDTSDERMAKLQARVKRYAQFGHKVWFMPTCGYTFQGQSDPSSAKKWKRPPGHANSEKAVLRQIRLALDAGVNDIVYFMGPAWWPNVDATSWHLHGKKID